MCIKILIIGFYTSLLSIDIGIANAFSASLDIDYRQHFRKHCLQPLITTIIFLMNKIIWNEQSKYSRTTRRKPNCALKSKELDKKETKSNSVLKCKVYS